MQRKESPSTPWSPTLSLRILIKDGKRHLQQRFTRLTHGEGQRPDEARIEEKWESVPTVSEES